MRERGNSWAQREDDFRRSHFNLLFFHLKKQHFFLQLLQRGVVTRRAAAAAGLKVEDQVSGVLSFLFFCAFGLFGERAECAGGGGEERERNGVLLCFLGANRRESRLFERGGGSGELKKARERERKGEGLLSSKTLA